MVFKIRRFFTGQKLLKKLAFWKHSQSIFCKFTCLWLFSRQQNYFQTYKHLMTWLKTDYIGKYWVKKLQNISRRDFSNWLQRSPPPPRTGGATTLTGLALGGWAPRYRKFSATTGTGLALPPQTLPSLPH